ncbi:transposase DNA-binding-containing protein, partial [Legionella sp.]
MVNFGDKRLSKKLLKIADSFANSPKRSNVLKITQVS